MEGHHPGWGGADQVQQPVDPVGLDQARGVDLGLQVGEGVVGAQGEVAGGPEDVDQRVCQKQPEQQHRVVSAQGPSAVSPAALVLVCFHRHPLRGKADRILM